MTTHASKLQSIVESLPEHLSERTWLATVGDSANRGKRVLYWTHHALRSDENPALDVAIHFAHPLNLPLLVYQGLSERYRFASDRHHTFILEAARDLQANYKNVGISFCFHLDRQNHRAPQLARLALSSAVVVTEDFPLEATKTWTDQLVASNSPAVVLVDTACVVPMRLVGRAYDRAFAFRDATKNLYQSRIDRPWETTKLAVEPDSKPPFSSLNLAERRLSQLVSECEIDHSVGPVSDTRGGSVAGYSRWQRFREDGLTSYAKRRNDIAVDGVSRMSAYLHYGMVSPFRIAREASVDGAEKYLDELLIWRELAYSFCYFRKDVESETCLPQWAIATLTEHERDPRRLLSWEVLARARSGERLWDAAQRSLLKHGELHNNVRMTWGKAILEWSCNHRESLNRLIDLNHRYALDGRDPASYGGILWCLGQFDRPFFPEQPILGSVRTRPVQFHEHRANIAAYERRVDRPTVNPSPRIAMIGAGLAGLMCTRILQDHGLEIQLFDKSHRPGGRTSTRQSADGLQFDHGAQYFTIRDSNLVRYLDSWVADQHVAQWNGKVVSIDAPIEFRELESLKRYVGTPSMESLARHLATDLRILFDTEVVGVSSGNHESGYQLTGKDQLTGNEDRDLGTFDIILWNCPPLQASRLVPEACDWQGRLSLVEMVPCWAVMIALEERWEPPFDGAFVNQGNLSWIARDSSKPARPTARDAWVLHSTIEWAKGNLATAKEQVVKDLMSEAERVTGCKMPKLYSANSHRWLYSRPVESLPEASLWDEGMSLGACGDWCGGPRVEGALKSGISLAGRVLGTLHETQAASKLHMESKQLSLFGDSTY